MADLFSSIGETWREALGISERKALCLLAYVDEKNADIREWHAIPPAVRERLIVAFMRAIELGSQCALAMKAAT